MKLRERRGSPGWRAITISVLIHATAAWLVPASWIRFGDGKADRDPGATSSVSVPFAALDPLTVIDVSTATEPDASETSEVQIDPDPIVAESSPRPTARQIAELLQRRASVAAPAASALETGGAGSSPEVARPPIPLAFRWPEYPQDAPRSRDPVTVEVRIWVEVDGIPGRIELSKPSGIELLDRKAREVAMGIRFQPAEKAGRAVAAWYRLPITFHP